MASVKLHRQLHRLYKNIHSMSDGQAIITESDRNNLWLRIEIQPNSGCYKGGRFEFTIILDENYPTVGPDIKCLTPIFHPNISSYELIYGYSDDADVCVSLLDEWSSSNTLEDCVQALLFLIHNPNLDDPLNPLFSPGQYAEQQFIDLAQKSLRGEEVEGCLYPWNYHLEMGNGSKELTGQESRNFYKSVDEEKADRCPCPVREIEMKDIENTEESVDEEEVDGWNHHFEDTPSVEGVTVSQISEEGEEFPPEEYKPSINEQQSFSEEESDYETTVVLATRVHRGSCLTNKESVIEHNEEEHTSFVRKATGILNIAKVANSQVTQSDGREEPQNYHYDEVEHLPRAQVVIFIIVVEQVDQYTAEESFIQQGRKEMWIMNMEANKNHLILECVDLPMIQEEDIYKCLFPLLATIISESGRKSIYSAAEGTKLQVLLEATDFKYKELIIWMSVGSVCFTRSAENSLMDKFSCAILPVPAENSLTYAIFILKLPRLKIEMDRPLKGKVLVICSDWADLVVVHESSWIQNEMTTKKSLSYTLLHKASLSPFEILLSPNIIKTLITGYFGAGVGNLRPWDIIYPSWTQQSTQNLAIKPCNIVTMVTVLPLSERMSCVKKNLFVELNRILFRVSKIFPWCPVLL